MKPKKIKYRRHEFRARSKSCNGTLLEFVYDIPYFPPCGVLPPLHILNSFFMHGGGDGGMSPGASWKPFTITQDEYADLAKAVKETPLVEIKPRARYAWVVLEVDASFDHLTDLADWAHAICEKHRDQWHARLRSVGKLS
jgi:hypothetical protein